MLSHASISYRFKINKEIKVRGGGVIKTGCIIRKTIIHVHEMILLITDDFYKPNQEGGMFLNTVTSDLTPT